MEASAANAALDTVQEGELLWTPSEQFTNSSHIVRFMRYLVRERGLSFADYESLWRWSVTHLEDFWAAAWDFFQVHSTTPYQRVLDRRVMPGAKWFEGSHVNYAEHMLRYEAQAAPGQPVIHHLSELRPLARLSWQELGRQVRILATQLRSMGIKPGDRIVAYMPNIPETAIAMLATTAIGAIWSSAAPEFGVRTVVDRFAQIQPKLMFAADGYRFGAKDFDRSAEVREIKANLPALETVVWLPYLHPENEQAPVEGAISWRSLMDQPDVPREAFQYEYVPYDHPLWILFSSGTTGLPKAIVHSHVGMVVEHLKSAAFCLNLKPDSCFFFYSTTGWMMWNKLLCALVQGSAIVLYDGNPSYPNPDLLWQLVAETGATSFGASPTYVQIMRKLGLKPREKFDLSKLQSIVVTGSPATPETFAWFYRNVKSDLWVTSQSGGTEVCTGLVGAAAILPVYAGEIQARLLGIDVHAWNDRGQELMDEVGELVVTSPAPSMPLYFWNDPGNQRYRESVFGHFPGVWRHGDFIKINRRGGCYIYGRSDSTLNRYGVRLGSAEIYRAVEQMEEIADSLIVCIELPGGNFFMPLFVKLKDGFELKDALRDQIKHKLRTDCSPRHVPDKIYEVPQIPYTLTGKKMEVPIRKILLGASVEKAASRDAMMIPAALDWFLQFARESIDYNWRG